MSFLRGCGLSDWQIEAAKLNQDGRTRDQATDIAYDIVRLYTDSPLQYFSCFISYSHADRSFCQAASRPAPGWGIRCWLDEHQIKPGEKIMRRVDEGIRHWDKVLLCCSKRSLTSWWVDKEIGMAFEKERLLWDERGNETLALIPIDVDGHLFKWEHPRATEIRERKAADFTGWDSDNPKFEEAFERVVQALRADDAAREKAPEGKL